MKIEKKRINKRHEVGLICYICNKEYKLSDSFKKHCKSDEHIKSIDNIKASGKEKYLIMTKLPGKCSRPQDEHRLGYFFNRIEEPELPS